jgi:alkylhydroperoxidase family enzyme
LFGKVLEPARVMAHQPKVLKTYLDLERSVQRWKRVDPQLKHLGVMAAAATVGCPWCMDFSYWASEQRGLPFEKARQVPQWREARCFSAVERVVLEFAEAMSSTPSDVSLDLMARLREHFDDAQVVELTAAIALENFRSRMNRGLGVVSQGFSDACEVPLLQARSAA